MVDNNKQIDKLGESILGAIKSIPQPKEDTTFKSRILGFLGSSVTKKDIKDSIDTIPRAESVKGEVNMIISTLRGLNIAKPEDIEKLSELLKQSSLGNQNTSSIFDQKLEAFNQLSGKNDEKIISLLNQIVIEMRRISSFKQDNANIINGLGEIAQ